jgi:hypothetical protein
MYTEIETWILTFNRPKALHRLVKNLYTEGIESNIFSNYPIPDPDIHGDYGVNRYFFKGGFIDLGDVVYNNLNSVESNSWCARSWNNIMLKAFDKPHVEAVCLIQDDTDVNHGFGDWLREKTQEYDFIWGPAGDQFHYITKDLFRKVGWWDENFLGCYAGDCDYLKRVWFSSVNDLGLGKLSIQESHPWGFNHNLCDLSQYVNTEMNSKACDPNYENQHWALEKIQNNPTLKYSQNHYKQKWGCDIDTSGPCINSNAQYIPEIDWYPWFSSKHKVSAYGY